MKKIFITLCYTLMLFSMIGCKKYLDVNKDPNTPSNVNESLILAPVIASISTNVAGGSFSTLNYNGVSEITSYWTQQIALNQDQPQIDGYKCKPDDVDQAWITMYTTILENLKMLDTKATQNGNNSYGVIAKILTAYTLGITTDLWGDIPYSKALKGLDFQLNPTYDKQEDIYKSIQALLDSAIVQNQKPTGGIVPSGDDYIYAGNMAKWEKFAYSLKARHYIHLTKAQGYTATNQADLALTAIAKAFTGTKDEAKFSSYSSAHGTESPWFVNTADDQGGVVLSSNLIDSLVSRNDPRLSIIATLNKNGVYSGREIGTDAVPNFKVFSRLNNFYAAAAANQSIMSFAEVQFIKAEATLIKSGAIAAATEYAAAINAGMSRLGLSSADPAVLTYVANRMNVYNINPLQAIIEDKVIANLLSTENYNDWRRTGYPVLSVVQNSFTPTIPVRLPYPLSERTSNSQPEHAVTYSTPVWWAK